MIKMSDVFKLPVVHQIGAIMCECVREGYDDGVTPYDVAEMAINNHDKLVGMLERVVELQKNHYGDGMTTHIKMIGMSDDISKLLNEINNRG